jgi:thiol-disulfide isomerase/thioredoxin
MRRFSKWCAVVAVAGGVMLFQACSPSAPADKTADSAAAPAASDDSGKKRARLDLTMKDLDGKEVTLSEFAGKVILLNFWATWCGPCRAEIPDLVALQQEHPDDLVVLGVVMMDTFGDKVRTMATDLKMTYRVLDGSDRTDVEEAYGPMWGLPTSVIVDRDGTIAKRQTGAASKEAFARMLEPLLAARQTSEE